MTVNNDFMMAYPSRKVFNPVLPQTHDCDIRDIANALGNLCRYGGHVPEFYSVAEHLVLQARYVLKEEGSRELAFAVLMDDGPEAYIGDMIGPMKRRMAEYRAVEDSWSAVIKKHFGFVMDGAMEEKVRDYDRRMLATEMRLMLGDDYVEAEFPSIAEIPLLRSLHLEYWPPTRARVEFRDIFDQLKPT